MKRNMCLATLILLGGVPLAGIGADYGTSGQSGAAATGSRDMSTGQSGMAGTQAQVPDQFKRLDKDKDGLISKSEAKRNKDLNARFDDVDSDHDGKVSLTEFQGWDSTRGAAGVPGSSREGGQSGMGSYGTGGSGMDTTSPGTSR